MLCRRAFGCKAQSRGFAVQPLQKVRLENKYNYVTLLDPKASLKRTIVMTSVAKGKLDKAFQLAPLFSEENHYPTDLQLQPRYFGLFDLVADWNPVLRGVQPLFHKMKPEPFVSSTKLTRRFTFELLTEGGGKFQWALENCPNFKELHDVAVATSDLLTQKKIPHVAYFDGAISFRILIKDTRLYFSVGRLEAYLSTYIDQIFPQYLQHLDCPIELQHKILSLINHNVHDYMKGFEVSLQEHRTSHLWPTPLSNFESRTTQHKPDFELNEQIRDHWEWIIDNVPESMYYLRGVPFSEFI